MSHLIVRHTVKDYGTWKKAFDEDEGNRSAAGSKGAMVFRNNDNPNEVVILMDWDGLEKARSFAGSPRLKEVMEQAGVAGRPDIRFAYDAGASAH